VLLLGPIESTHARATWIAPLLSTDFDVAARAIAGLLDVPVVLISMLADQDHVFVGAHGVLKESADHVTPLCLEVATLQQPVLMQDARRHLVAGARDDRGIALVAFMGLPITGRDGTCLGAVCTFREEHRRWSRSDLIMLRSFVELLTALLTERRHSLCA
jgi:GAF domain-containing protein